MTFCNKFKFELEFYYNYYIICRFTVVRVNGFSKIRRKHADDLVSANIAEFTLLRYEPEPALVQTLVINVVLGLEVLYIYVTTAVEKHTARC